MAEHDEVKEKLDKLATQLFEAEWQRYAAGLTGTETELMNMRRTCSMWFGLGRWAAAREMQGFHRQVLEHLGATAGYYDFPPSVD